MIRDPEDTHGRAGGRSRPRSKIRPSYPDARPALVVAVDRGRYTCALIDEPDRDVTAVRARELGRRGAVVGDEVRLHGDLSGGGDHLARLVAIEPRTTELRRTADDTDPFERVIVANVDQMGIVVALQEPPPRPGLIDRCLVAAFDAGIRPALLLTKTDLTPAEPLLRRYGAIDVAIVEAGREADPTPVSELLAGHRTVLVGHSGVGKSTLVNSMASEADRATGAVNQVTGRGRHVSSSVRALALPGPAGGWVIDTPGVRSFGLAHVDRDRVVRSFSDLSPALADCPRGCTHRESELSTVIDPDCALDALVESGMAGRDRLVSLRRILAALDGDLDC